MHHKKRSFQHSNFGFIDLHQQLIPNTKIRRVQFLFPIYFFPTTTETIGVASNLHNIVLKINEATFLLTSINISW